jgi:predicted kinase
MKAKKPLLHLLVGNIASGKSTLAGKIKKEDHFLLELDTLGRLFLKDEKVDERSFKIARILVFKQAVEKRQNIIVDGNLMSASDRSEYIEIAKKNNYWIICYDLGRGEIAQLEFRIINNPEFSKEIWINSFYSKQICYQKPNETERIDEIIIVRNKINL